MRLCLENTVINIVGKHKPLYFNVKTGLIQTVEEIILIDLELSDCDIDQYWDNFFTLFNPSTLHVDGNVFPEISLEERTFKPPHLFVRGKYKP